MKVRVHARRQLRALPASGPVTAVARQMAGSRASADERHWIERIEAVREELGASRDEIEITRYHAYTSVEEQASTERDRAWTDRTSVGRDIRRMSIDRVWGLFLMRLARAARPATSLELGTAFGISAAYQAAGLELAGKGRLVTLEGDETLCSLARANIETVGLGHRVEVHAGPVREQLGDVLSAAGQVDFAFIDASHNAVATFAYIEQIGPALSPGAVIVFDDIRLSAEMTGAWVAITAKPAMALTADFGRMGVAIWRQ